MDLRLEEAVQYVHDHPEDSVRSISRLFDVKRSTLRNRLNGAKPRKGRPGTNKLFSEAEEKAICDYIDRTERVNPTVPTAFVTDAANVILAARHGSRDGSPPPTVGINWTARFMKRHGYSQRAQKKAQSSDNTDSVTTEPQARTPSPLPSIPVESVSITPQQLDTLAERLEESLQQPDLGIKPELAQRLTRLVKNALVNTPDLVQAKHDPSRAKHAERIQKQRRSTTQMQLARKVAHAQRARSERLRKAAKKAFAEAAKEARRRRISGRLDPAQIVASGPEAKMLRRF